MKVKVIGCVLLVLFLIGFSEIASAATNYRGAVVGPFPENNGYYARLSSDRFKSMSWDEARRYAGNLYISRGGRRYNGFLFTPNTQTENAYVKNALSPNEDWLGMFQVRGAQFPSSNWKLLNGRSVTWWGWGSGEPDDQKNGVQTRCTLVNFFDGATFTTNGDSFSFTQNPNPQLETGCENCGMMRADGTWKDKECNKHGNGFIVEFR
jgi:hypothetical protein